MGISIVIPALNEAGNLAASIASARAPGALEVIVVDGGSADDTVQVAREHADCVIAGRRGRAVQMNAGAAIARGDVFLFLHADTLLPPGFDVAVLTALADVRFVGGRFDVCLRPSSFLLWLTARMINLRSRLTRIGTGDQAIFVRAEVFRQLGGFQEISLMEDLAFSLALKRCGRVACLREQVVTSSRRWLRDGVLRTVALMWLLRFLYFCGVPPERLRRAYADRR